MKTKFDIGEIVMVPSKIRSISIDDGKIEYLVTAEKARIGEVGRVNMRVKEENLVGLADDLEPLQMKLREIVTWVNESPNHRLNIETNGKGKIIGARLEVKYE